MKSTATLVLSILIPCCLSCGRDSDALRIEIEQKASEMARQVKGQSNTIPNAQQIKEEIERLIAAVEQKDLQRLKKACDVVDFQFGTHILVKYYKAFSLEIAEGPPRVIEYLNNEIDNLADDDMEKSALTGLRKYFEAKGSVTTRDAAVLILLVALETKFPHGRGTIFVAPFLDLPKSQWLEGNAKQPSAEAE